MKKFRSYFIFLIVIVGIILGIVYDLKKNYHTVSVYISEKETFSTYKVRNKKTLKPLDNPSMEGYAFAGWYYLESDKEFSFEDPITEDITIIAKWAKITIQ